MKGLMVRFVREDEGQDLIEYALLATVIALVVFVGAQMAGISLNTCTGISAGPSTSGPRSLASRPVGRTGMERSPSGAAGSDGPVI